MFKVIALAIKTIAQENDFSIMSWDNLPQESLLKKSMQRGLNLRRSSEDVVIQNYTNILEAQLKSLQIIQVSNLDLSTQRSFLSKGHEVTFLSLKPSLDKAKIETLIKSYLMELGVSDYESLTKIFIDLAFDECQSNSRRNPAPRIKLKTEVNQLNVEGNYRGLFSQVLTKLKDYALQQLGIDITKTEHYVLYSENGSSIEAPTAFVSCFMDSVQKDDYQTEYFVMHTHPKYTEEALKTIYGNEHEQFECMAFRQFLSPGDKDLLGDLARGVRARGTGVLSDFGLHFVFLMPKVDAPFLQDGFGPVGTFVANNQNKSLASYMSYIRLMKDYYNAGDFKAWKRYVQTQRPYSEVFDVQKIINKTAASYTLEIFFQKLAKIFVATDGYSDGQKQTRDSLIEFINNNNNVLTQEYREFFIGLLLKNNIDEIKEIMGIKPKSQLQIVEPREQFLLKQGIVSYFVSNDKIDFINKRTQGEFTSLSMEDRAEFVFLTGMQFRHFISNKFKFSIFFINKNITLEDYGKLQEFFKALRESTSLNEARSIAKQITEFCENIYN